jgi:hypothetical protein
MAPQRIQLSRAKGWKLPPNTVKVDRSTMWGNPHRVGDIHPYANSEDLADPARVEELRIDAETAVALYGLGCATANMLSNDNPFAVLRGKNLACWCALDAPCHADVLIELANGEDA